MKKDYPNYSSVGLPLMSQIANYNVSSGLFLLLLLFSASCTNVLENEKKSVLRENDTGARIGNEVRASISFESETVTFTRTEGDVPEKFASFYRIIGVPVVSNTRLETLFLVDGQTETTITNLPPTVKISSGKENIPADNSPKISVTKIKNGYASTYDESGKLLSKSEFPTANFDHLIINPNSVDFDAKLAEFRQNGSIVTNISKSLVSVRTKINPSEYSSNSTSNQANNNEFENVSFLDKDNKVIFRSILLNQNGEVVQEVFYKYKSEPDQARKTLESQHIESKRVDGNGIRCNTITDIHFRNFTSVNL